MTSTRHTGTISLTDAERQTEAVKKIMAEQKLNFGPAYDVYIKRQSRRVFPVGHLPRSAFDGMHD